MPKNKSEGNGNMQEDTLKDEIKFLNDFYILQRYKYIELYPNHDTYNTIDLKKSPQKPVLADWLLKQHLTHKRTIGVFAGYKDNQQISKFMTFDVDVHDDDENHTTAKWYSYKVINTLQENGINDFAVSFSGNKGYHIDLFFDAPVEVNKLKKFYHYILNQSEIKTSTVEFRPTYGQAVKLPLGVNFRNTSYTERQSNHCHFVDYENNMSEWKSDTNYINSFKKIDNVWFGLFVDNIEETKQAEKNIKDYQHIQEKYKKPEVYKENIDEDLTLESLKKLEENGLDETHPRHNSLIKICKLYKYYGMLQEDNQINLTAWMEAQDKNTYKTSWDKVLIDIEQIVKYVYENDCDIVHEEKDITVTYNEMLKVLDAKSKTEKLLLYAMLIHSKRYATKTGKFYFPYSLMNEATGLSRPTLISNVNYLNDNKFIEIISRNESIEHKELKKPNQYKIAFNVEYSDKTFAIPKEQIDLKESLDNCIVSMFNNKEIKKLCGRRYYTEIIKKKTYYVKN